jgi:hypothetical protein
VTGCKLAHALLGWVTALGLASVLHGCATDSAALHVAAMPEPTRTSPEHYVVVTVRNAPTELNPHAGSTPRGYGGYRPYRATAAAIETARRVAQRHRLREVAAWPIELLRVHCVVYEMAPGAQREKVLAALRADAAVESAQALMQFELQSGRAGDRQSVRQSDQQSASFNDAYAGLQRNLIDMDIAAAHQWSLGDGVRLAVIDTGVDIGHPDFGGRLAAVRDFVIDGGRADERHGTAVAGVIAAVPNNAIGIVGIAPQATVTAIRACWSSSDDGSVGSCNSFTVAQALVAALRAQVALVNLSFGGPTDPLLQRIVERAMRRGALFVGAAPASGRREGFPTGIEGVIAVDVAGQLQVTPNALLAPGVDVYTLSPRGGYDAASGSSMAAAGVTGVVALLLARRPGLRAHEVEAVLQRSMRKGIADVPAATVNACLALRELLDDGTCTAPALGAGRSR